MTIYYKEGLYSLVGDNYYKGGLIQYYLGGTKYYKGRLYSLGGD
jgi:hypothetical protein